MEKCRACGRPGHIQRACQTNPATLSPKHDHKVRKTKVNELNVEEEPIYLLKVNAVGGIRGAIWVHPNTNEKLLPMELDTGSAISVINEETYDEKFSDVNLTDTNINLNTYLGESIAQLGVFTVTVDLNDKKKHSLDLYVIQKGGPPLFGQEWLRNIKLNWAEIKAIETLKKGFVGCWTHTDEYSVMNLTPLRESMQESKLESRRHQNSVKLAQFSSHSGLRWTRNWIV